VKGAGFELVYRRKRGARTHKSKQIKENQFRKVADKGYHTILNNNFV